MVAFHVLNLFYKFSLDCPLRFLCVRDVSAICPYVRICTYNTFLRPLSSMRLELIWFTIAFTAVAKPRRRWRGCERDDDEISRWLWWSLCSHNEIPIDVLLIGVPLGHFSAGTCIHVVSHWVIEYKSVSVGVYGYVRISFMQQSGFNVAW